LGSFPSLLKTLLPVCALCAGGRKPAPLSLSLSGAVRYSDSTWNSPHFRRMIASRTGEGSVNAFDPCNVFVSLLDPCISPRPRLLVLCPDLRGWTPHGQGRRRRQVVDKLCWDVRQQPAIEAAAFERQRVIRRLLTAQRTSRDTDTHRVDTRILHPPLFVRAPSDTASGCQGLGERQPTGGRSQRLSSDSTWPAARTTPARTCVPVTRAPPAMYIPRRRNRCSPADTANPPASHPHVEAEEWACAHRHLPRSPPG